MSSSASNAKAIPVANAAAAKPPTSTPIIASAHHVLNGSLHLLQDTLTDAGTASRFYPTSSSLVGAKLQAVANANNKQKATNSKFQSERLDGQHHGAPATSSFTAPDRHQVGPTRSTRVASLHNSNTAASSSAAHRARSLTAAQQGTNNAKRNSYKTNAHTKNNNQVGKIKVSIGDAAHHFWSRLMGNKSKANTKRSHNRTRTSQNKTKKHPSIKDSIKMELPTSPLKTRTQPKSEDSAEHRQQSKKEIMDQQETNPHVSSSIPLDVPQIQVESSVKNANPPNTIFSTFSSETSPSIPLYPLLFLIFLHHLLTRVFSFRNRTKMHRKFEGMLGSKKFGLSQEELTRHIELLAERNKNKGRKRGGHHDGDSYRGGRNGDGGGAGNGKNGDAAGGYAHGAGKREDFKKENTHRENKSINKSGDHSTEEGTLNSTLHAISESLKQFKDEKEELIHQSRLLLQDRDCIFEEKEVLLSEKKLFLKILAEKDEECQRLVRANQELKENAEMLEFECATANDTAQNLAEKLANTKNEKNALSSSLEARKLSHAEVVASIAEWKERFSESEAKVTQLTNENIILKNVIARLEEENNEMEKVIDEACRSGNGDVDIDEIDCAIVSSCDGVSEAESLTRDDDDSVDSQVLKRRAEENTKLCLEKETLQTEVDELQQLLSRTRSELETLSSERDENTKSHTSPSQENDKLDELKHEMSSSLSRIQDERDQLRNQVEKQQQLIEEATTNLSRVQDQRDQLQVQLSQRTKELSIVESKMDELLQSEKDISSTLSQVQNERDKLQAQLSQQSKALSHVESQMDELQKSQEEIASSLSQVQNERDKLQEHLATVEKQTKDDKCMDESNAMPHATVESIKKKNDQLQHSLADIESLYETLRAENNQLQKSFELTSDRFRSLLSKKESLQKSLRKERKRIAKCNTLLKDSLECASTLITELRAEIQWAHGISLPDQQDQRSEMMSEISGGASEGDVLLQNAKSLRQELSNIKRTKQHLVLAVQKLISDVIARPELSEEFSNCINSFDGVSDDFLSGNVEKVSLSEKGSATCDQVSCSMSNLQIGGPLHPTRRPNQTHESPPTEALSDRNVIRRMLDMSKSTSHLVQDGNVRSIRKMPVTTLETEMNNDTKPIPEKNNSPTNFPLMRRLWRKKSSS
ncbi:hypothetical protein ACHAW6_013357 [Cyclotella cf. meneghiniana]